MEQCVSEARAPIKEAELEKIKQKKLDQRPGGQAIEEFFLVKAAAVEITLKKSSSKAEGLLAETVLQNLLGFKGAVGVVAG